MKKLISLFIALLCQVSLLRAQAVAPSLTPSQHLYKMSMHLKGHKPLREEYIKLSELKKSEEIQKYLSNKADEYLKSSLHQQRMRLRLNAKFQTASVHLNELNPSVPSPSSSSYEKKTDALDELFLKVIKDNLSWDTLLTGKDYSIGITFHQKASTAINEFQFFASLMPDLKNAPDAQKSIYDVYYPRDYSQKMPISFDAHDLRIAGSLSTPRFLTRYNTTHLNRNRKRAAAVFKIFLCDKMSPVIPPLANKKKVHVDYSFEDEAAQNADPHKSVKELYDNNRHASDPRCNACHYKLDPLGKAFQNIGLVMHPLPSKGVLTYRRTDGELLKKSFQGLGELAQQITEQPEYLECQISWFWNEFIGEDYPLTPDRKQELIQIFEQNARRPHEFIKQLVLSREFVTPQMKDEVITYTHVKPLLKRCDTCHINEQYIPAFAQGQLSSQLAFKIKDRLLKADYDKNKMPSNWQTWNPNDLRLLHQWIKQGARTSENTPLLPEEQ